MKKVTQPVVKKKLPDYVYNGLGLALSNACDELERGEAIESVFHILTTIGYVECRIQKIRRGK
jgi:hypothetical protein